MGEYSSCLVVLLATLMRQVRQADNLQLKVDLELDHVMQATLALLQREENANW